MNDTPYTPGRTADEYGLHAVIHHVGEGGWGLASSLAFHVGGVHHVQEPLLPHHASKLPPSGTHARQALVELCLPDLHHPATYRVGSVQ